MTADHKVVSARFRIHLLINPGFLFLIVLGFFCLAPASPQGNHITDSLSVLLKQSKRQAALLNKIAAEYNHISYSGALGIATEALEAARKEGNEHEAAYAWYNMACNYMSRGAYDSSGIMLERSLKLAEKLGDELAILRVGNANASISFLKGRLDESLREFESSLEQAREAGLTEIIISAVANIGRIHWLQGRNESALRCYDEALSMADSVRNKYMSALIHLFRGILYQTMGFYELAAGSISGSVAIFEQMNYLDKLPYAYNYLGSVYMDLVENDNAMTFFRKALVLFERNNDIWGKAIAARFMGSIYNEKGRSDSAGCFIRESLALAARLNDLNGMLFSRRFLAELMLKTGKPDSARVLLLGNLKDALKTDNRLHSFLSGPGVKAYCPAGTEAPADESYCRNFIVLQFQPSGFSLALPRYYYQRLALSAPSLLILSVQLQYPLKSGHPSPISLSILKGFDLMPLCRYCRCALRC